MTPSEKLMLEVIGGAIKAELEKVAVKIAEQAGMILALEADLRARVDALEARLPGAAARGDRSRERFLN